MNSDLMEFKINEIKDYLELISKRLNKYIASFDYFDKPSIVLSAASGSISVASFATVIGTPVGIASTSLAKKEQEIKRKIIIRLLCLLEVN